MWRLRAADQYGGPGRDGELSELHQLARHPHCLFLVPLSGSPVLEGAPRVGAVQGDAQQHSGTAKISERRNEGQSLPLGSSRRGLGEQWPSRHTCPYFPSTCAQKGQRAWRAGGTEWRLPRGGRGQSIAERGVLPSNGGPVLPRWCLCIICVPESTLRTNGGTKADPARGGLHREGRGEQQVSPSQPGEAPFLLRGCRSLLHAPCRQKNQGSLGEVLPFEPLKLVPCRWLCFKLTDAASSKLLFVAVLV